MGQGFVAANLGEGLYRVRIGLETSRARARIEALRQEANDLAKKEDGLLDAAIAAERDAALNPTVDGKRAEALAARAEYNRTVARRVAALSAADKIEALLPGEIVKEAWCADYSLELSDGLTVGTVEIPGELTTVQIRPGFEGAAAWAGNRDGKMSPPIERHPGNVFIDLLLYPGWQKWRPKYRHGVISDVDKEADTCTVKIDATHSMLTYWDAKADGGGQRRAFDVNQDQTTFENVSIEYMDCNAQPFENGDEVLVFFPSGRWANPKVIGFAHDPKPCGGPYWLQIFLDGAPAVAGYDAWVFTDVLGATPAKLTDGEGYAGEFLPEEAAPPPVWPYFDGRRYRLPLIECPVHKIERDLGDGMKEYDAYELYYLTPFVVQVLVNQAPASTDTTVTVISDESGTSETSGIDEAGYSTTIFRASALPAVAWAEWSGRRYPGPLYDAPQHLVTRDVDGEVMEIPAYMIEYEQEIFFVRVLIDGEPAEPPAAFGLRWTVAGAAHETPPATGDALGYFGPFDQLEITSPAYGVLSGSVGTKNVFAAPRHYIERDANGTGVKEYPAYTLNFRALFILMTLYLSASGKTVDVVYDLTRRRAVPITFPGTSTPVTYHICDGTTYEPPGYPWPGNNPVAGVKYFDPLPVNAPLKTWVEGYAERAWGYDFASWPGIGLVGLSSTDGIYKYNPLQCFVVVSGTLTNPCGSTCEDSTTRAIPAPVPAGHPTKETYHRRNECTNLGAKSGCIVQSEQYAAGSAPVWRRNASNYNAGRLRMLPDSQWGWNREADYPSNKRSKRYWIADIERHHEYDGITRSTVTEYCGTTGGKDYVYDETYTCIAKTDSGEVGRFSWTTHREGNAANFQKITGQGCAFRSWSFPGEAYLGISVVIQEHRVISGTITNVSLESYGPPTITVDAVLTNNLYARHVGHAGAPRDQAVADAVEALIRYCYSLSEPISTSVSTNNWGELRVYGFRRAMLCDQPYIHQDMLTLINNHRAGLGLTPVICSYYLELAAGRHALDMSVNPWIVDETVSTDMLFKHIGSDGSRVWNRAEDAGYGSMTDLTEWGVAENVAMVPVGTSPAVTFQLWLDSPPHRATIENPIHRELGIAVRTAIRAADGYEYEFHCHVFGHNDEH